MLPVIILLSLMPTVSYECAATSSVSTTTTTAMTTTTPTTASTTSSPTTTTPTTTTTTTTPTTTTTTTTPTTTTTTTTPTTTTTTTTPTTTTTTTTPTTTTSTTTTTTTSTTTTTPTTTTTVAGNCGSCAQDLAQGAQTAPAAQDGVAVITYTFDGAGCIVPTVECFSVQGNFLTSIALQENEALLFGAGCPSVTLPPGIIQCNAMGQWISTVTGNIQPVVICSQPLPTDPNAVTC